ncbi:transcriptional regulator PpsR [Rhodopila sp.]|uniref:transcriptional regulator PpsR n=1 Tax=Rhodopila sp. TaxID=2480087 RepID=UPI003D0CA757
MKAFRTPKTALGNIDAEAAAALVAAAADIALILDASGVIHDVSIADQGLVDDLPGHVGWLGKRWFDVVTEESRPKVEAMLAEAASKGEPRWRHLNHPAAAHSAATSAGALIEPAAADIPILYAAVPAGVPGRIVAFGRDLRAVSSLQRRLIDAQQSMERDYARTRHVETRYRLLFQMASDAVLIVDGASQRVLDSNPTARRLLANAAEPGQRWPVTAIFTAESARSVDLLLAGVRASGRADDVRAKLVEGEREVVVSASLFHDESGVACLVRIASLHTGPAEAVLPKLKTKLLKLMESAPDGFVVTGFDGRVLTANATFLQLAQLPTEEQARNEPLSRWLGRNNVDLDILTANLRQYGSVRLFASQVRGDLGKAAEVEISAVTVMNGGQPCFGYAIRDVGRRLRREPEVERAFPRSLEHLTELIGRVALKDLVREATDVIERLCIEAALNLTGDNRASAAEMLGLSRQSLYVKLRRYGLGDPEAQGAD